MNFRHIVLYLGSLLLPAMLPLPAGAQAPAEERGHRTDSYAEAQQRVEFARKASEQAESDLRLREREFQDADTALKAVQKQFDDSRAKLDRARKVLSDAANRSTEAKRAFDREAAAFERLRKADSAPKAKK